MRVLFLLNPGRQSRHYILGLCRAAERLALPHLALELGPLWDRVSSATDKKAALQAIQTEVSRLVAMHRITHAVGYVYNGTFDLGLVSRAGAIGRGLFPSLGVRHILLWTDHPEWASGGIALRPPLLDILRDPLMVHILKSEAAAREAAEILGWPNISWLPMAEDAHSFQPAPGISPVYDVVVILGDARPLPSAAMSFLDHPDPDPAAIDEVMRPEALSRFTAAHPDFAPLASAWLDAKRISPTRSFWTIASQLSPTHQQAILKLKQSPEHWYSAVSALRVMVEWRRFFWPAWLSRRVNVGIYGSNASDLGVPQTSAAREWVPYEQQPATYALGRVALNTNAAHDEEGLTHKPFQIAASGVPMVHHEAQGLDECFQPRQETAVFRRGPELLEAVHAPTNPAMAQAALERTRREHTWEDRLLRMLAVAGAQEAISRR